MRKMIELEREEWVMQKEKKHKEGRVCMHRIRKNNKKKQQMGDAKGEKT